MIPDDELTEIGRQAHSGFTEDEMTLACLVYLGRSKLPHDNLSALAADCVKSYADQTGISWPGILSAIQALERADETFRYLRSLPD